MEVTGTIVDYVNGKLKRFDVNHAAWVVFIQQLEFDAVMFENRDFYFPHLIVMIILYFWLWVDSWFIQYRISTFQTPMNQVTGRKVGGILWNTKIPSLGRDFA